jgi:hypothetical protein
MFSCTHFRQDVSRVLFSSLARTRESFCLALLCSGSERTRRGGSGRRAANRSAAASRTGRDYAEDTLPSSFALSWRVVQKHSPSREPSFASILVIEIYALIAFKLKSKMLFSVLIEMRFASSSSLTSLEVLLGRKFFSATENAKSTQRQDNERSVIDLCLSSFCVRH